MYHLVPVCMLTVISVLRGHGHMFITALQGRTEFRSHGTLVINLPICPVLSVLMHLTDNKDRAGVASISF